MSSCNNGKVCIQTRRVFDACLRQYTLTNQTLAVTFDAGVTPATFVSLKNTGNGTISNLTVTPLSANNGCSRVSYSVDVPLQITATDTAGNTVLGTATITLLQDVVLKVPTGGSVFPTSIENVASLASIIGTFDGTTLTANICVAIISKVVAEVELFIPAYGYLTPRNCTEYSDNFCQAFLGQPLFPTDI